MTVDSQSEDEARRIPAEIKRLVRQRCGFGCVICGTPLYEYEHMLEWAAVKRHRVEEITLLCDMHHREKTSGLLDKEAVAEADRNPYNMRVGTSKPHRMHFQGPEVEIDLGSNWLRSPLDFDLVAVMIDQMPLIGFRFEEGNFLLNVLLFDENNRLLLHISDNELVQSTDPWDIEFVGQKLTLRTGPRKIFFTIIFEPPGRIRIERGHLLFNGVEVLIEGSAVFIVNSNSILHGNVTIGVPIGLNLGTNLGRFPCLVRQENLTRYGVDRDKRIKEFRKEVRANTASSG